MDHSKGVQVKMRKNLIDYLTPGQKKNILKVQNYIGKKYSIVQFDLSICLYHDLKNGIDIEIEGVTDKKRDYSVYIWRGRNIIDQKSNITTLHELEYELDLFTEIYGNHSNK